MQAANQALQRCSSCSHAGQKLHARLQCFAGRLEAGIQEEVTGRFVQVNVTSGQLIIIPQGMYDKAQLPIVKLVPVVARPGL